MTRDGEKMKKISIIVPVYNSAKTIKRCLDSLINQTYNNLEIIVVDDGSNDESATIIKLISKQESFVKYFYQPNSGVSAARNRGLLEATGEYIMFVDSDDCIKENACELLCAAFGENTDLVVCGLNVYAGDQLLRSPHIAAGESYLFDSIDFYWELRKINLGPCNKMYKSFLIDKKFDLDLSFGEDTKFVIDYMRNCKVIHVISDCLYDVHIDNPNSLNRSDKRKKLNQLVVVRKYELQFLKDKYPNSNDSRIYERFFLDLHVVLCAIVEKNENVYESVQYALNAYEYKILSRKTHFKSLYYKVFVWLITNNRLHELIYLIKFRITLQEIYLKK